MLKAVQRAFLDCMRTSTGHGLPQMAKTDNIFLSLLWVVFFLVGVGGGIFMIHQTVGEFLQYGVITTTKIIRENEITMPAFTLCSFYNPRDMIMSCSFGRDSDKCKMTDLILFDRSGVQFDCIQLNYGTNVTELVKSSEAGYIFGYTIYVYVPLDNSLPFAITDNSAKVVHENIYRDIFHGQLTEIALSKTVQTALAQPHSDCNEDKDYRQVNCIDECFNKKMTEICGCPYPTECGENDDWAPECKEALTEKAGSIRSQCSLNCPIECNQVNFAVNRVDVDWELEAEYFDYYKSEVSKNVCISAMTDDQFRKRFTKIHIYFSKLETTEITQSPSMTLTSLIANMGGLLGKSLYLLYFFKET